ncbi:hypothetical protein EWM64_g3992 [Hericium alpestre]|uniref:NADP-dependent oxidoreductase domain-containing protein n=1 Tax=Hericium alpestre TaxID=135208 RepID=A0A4Z0A1F8_9AGAM|nr:hypothetical protein EWM64_g3992 [Hericium alpestre]
MSSQVTYILNTGDTIPAIAFGTPADGIGEDKIINFHLTVSALKLGYRHLDTAYLYGTERATGRAVRESGIPREEIFVTTKLPWHHHHKVSESFDQSLSALGLDYVDMYLMHWPQAAKFYRDDNLLPLDQAGDMEIVDTPTFNEVWAEMEAIYASGKAKAIGVSNFSEKTLIQLFTTAKVIPAVNQIELHPLLAQPALLEFCKSKGILVQAYSPTGHALGRENPLIVSLAEKYKATPNQVIVGWHLARGCGVIISSRQEDRNKENFAPVSLEKEDVDKITALDENKRVCTSPSKTGKVFGWTLKQLGW